MPNFTGYIILEELDYNAHNKLYRVIRQKDQVKMVFKTTQLTYPLPTDIAAIHHEYQLLKQLEAIPNIIRAYDVIKIQNQPVILLEDFIGQPLLKFLNSNPLSLKQFFIIALQLIDIIISLHKCKIIHKDINPYNFIINPNDLSVKLISLNIASELSLEPQHDFQFKALEGHLQYLSPEQTGRMNRVIDYRSDFYSLGITLYTLLVGHPPFTSTDALELVYCHIATVPPLVTALKPDLPPILAALIAKLLEKLPEERYLNALGIKSDLERCAKDWHNNQMIGLFPLGETDFQDQLQISQQLYGREQSLNILFEIFERVEHGTKELLLLSGYAGIGKTTLIHETQKQIIQHQGYFIEGQFEPLEHSMPYSALIKAFQSLVRQRLVEPEDKLLVLKQDLITALGINAAVIIDILPELKLIIGEHPPVSTLGPTEAKNRFHRVFQAFIRVFSQIDHPLVLFCDDVQWADSASLQLIENLILDSQSQYLFLIMAYRTADSIDNPALQNMLQGLDKSPTPIQTIILAPLESTDILQLLSDSLSMPPETLSSLSQIIQQKTQGNPFFIHQFLKLVYERGLLKFSYTSRSWLWDNDEINTLAATDNVVDLMARNLQTLPPATQELIKLAACIGNPFSLNTLSLISKLSIKTIMMHLYPAIQAIYLIPTDKTYFNGQIFKELSEETLPYSDNLEMQFFHDRLLQAAYSLIPEASKQNIHLTLGRLLLKTHRPEGPDQALFKLLHHFNQSLDQIKDPKERTTIAYLNLNAGKKVKASIAYQVALNYFQAGIFLLKDNSWITEYTLTFELHKEHSLCQYLIGDFEAAEAQFDNLMMHVRTHLEKAEIYRIKLILYIHRNQNEEALKMGLAALKLFNIHIPLFPKAYHIIQSLLKIYYYTNFKNKKHLRTHQNTLNPEHIMVCSIIKELESAAYIFNPKLLVTLTCQGVLLSFTQGSSIHSFSCFVGYALLLLKFKNFDKAFYNVDIAKSLVEKYNDIPSRARFKTIYTLFFMSWQHPYRACAESAQAAIVLNTDIGDFIFASYSKANYQLYLFVLGTPLEQSHREITATKDFFNSIRYEGFNLLLECYTIIIENLQQEDIDFKDTNYFFNKLNTGAIGNEAWRVFVLYGWYLYIAGLYTQALPLMEDAYLNRNYGLGSVLNHELYLIYALLLIQNYPLVSTLTQQQYLKRINALCTEIGTWNKQCPSNIQHKLFFLKAEIAQLKNNYAEAEILYDKAIVAANNDGFIQYVGIINECTARFYLKQNKPKFAKTYLQDAALAYQSWGGCAKVKQLEQTYSSYFNNPQPLTDQANTQPISLMASLSPKLDMISLLKSTQAISSEIELKKLLTSLLKILLENAGAHRGLLIARTHSSWVIEAEGGLEEQCIDLTQLDLMEKRSNLPLKLLDYTRRTEQLMVINNVHFSPQAQEDPYFANGRIKSLVILPIFYQNQLNFMVYLENHATTEAFTKDHTQILQMLASQAAISLANAHLYYQATHDPLTGVANRNLLYQTFNHNTGAIDREKKLMAILFIDIDHFKSINDTLGHEIGDKLLVFFCETINLCTRKEDLLARLGGDEFIILLDSIENVSRVSDFIKRVYAKLAKPISIDGHIIQMNFSVGISLYPLDGQNIETLLKKADIALYRVKEQGKNHYQFYSNEINEQLKQRNSKEIELQKALDCQEFVLYYQPIVDAKTNKLRGFEALLRWNHPTRGIIGPQEFIPTLEKLGLINPVGEWVIRSACIQNKIWQDQGLPIVSIAVNISGIQFKKPHFSEFITSILKEVGVDAKCILLEITESLLIDIPPHLLTELQALKKSGVQFAIDDFGTGYSNLLYLKSFPLNKLKVDQSFIKDIETDADSRTIVATIITMAHNLNLRTVAEGVETPGQLKLLQQLGADEIQGYLFSKPIPAEACLPFLNNTFLNNTLKSPLAPNA